MAFSEEAKTLLKAALDLMESARTEGIAMLAAAFCKDVECGGSPEGFKVGACAALMQLFEGDSKGALGMLVEIKAAAKAFPEHLTFNARENVFWVDFIVRYRTLTGSSYLDGICDEGMAQMGDGAEGPHYAGALMAMARGRFSEALRELSAAYSVADKSASPAYGHRHSMCSTAADCALSARRPKLAREWNALPNELDENEGDCPEFACERLLFATRLALYRRRPRAALRAAKLMVERNPTNKQAALMLARTCLLSERKGDPAAPGHPSRVQLRRKFFPYGDWGSRHERLVTVLDYRLACVAFTLGVAWTDLMWAQTAPEARTISKKSADADETSRRLRSAANQMNRALKSAHRIDEAFGGTWWSFDLERRAVFLKRLESVAETGG